MQQLYFTVPRGTHETMFGIPDKDGAELYHFYLMFIDSALCGISQVIGFGDCTDDEFPMEARSEVCFEQKGGDFCHELIFKTFDGLTVRFQIYYSKNEYLVEVTY